LKLNNQTIDKVTRRDCLKWIALGPVAGCFIGCRMPEAGAGKTPGSADRTFSRVKLLPAFAPESLRSAPPPFPQVDAVALQRGGNLARFRVGDALLAPDQQDAAVFFRLTMAGRAGASNHIDLILPESREVIGTLDLRFPVTLQVFQVEIPAKRWDAVRREGVGLFLRDGDETLNIVTTSQAKDSAWEAFCPHFLLSSKAVDKREALLDALFSVRTLAPFGWEEGCVTDALLQLRDAGYTDEATAALRTHFGAFGALDHACRTDLHSIEATLPIAALARMDPEHPMIERAAHFWWHQRLRTNGVVADFSTTGEGAYTVAYPMAVVGAQTGDKDMQSMAFHQLRERMRRLRDGNDLYLRQNPDTFRRSYRNWARAYAWYMLGIVRTLQSLQDMGARDLRREFVRISEIAVERQRPDGLWSCFLDRPELLPDTSGSAGIAAAMAEGVRLGLLTDDFREPAAKTWRGLQSYLTPDGLLTGVAQSNRGGLSLQESDYRVMLSMGAGLAGQLYAALRRLEV